MDKYTELKEQVLNELKWLIEDINEMSDVNISEDITLVDFIGKVRIDPYQRGMLFAYLSIKSKIDSIEGES